jgi:hypothetical protein
MEVFDGSQVAPFRALSRSGRTLGATEQRREYDNEAHDGKHLRNIVN